MDIAGNDEKWRNEILEIFKLFKSIIEGNII